MLILSQGRLGKEDGIKGSLGSGVSFAHVKYDLIKSSIAQDSAGHQTDIRALARHLLMPRWPRWMQSITSSPKSSWNDNALVMEE